MSDLCTLIWCALIGLFRSRVALEAEILVLRHQLNVLRRKSPKRLAFGNVDRSHVYRLPPWQAGGRRGCVATPRQPRQCVIAAHIRHDQPVKRRPWHTDRARVSRRMGGFTGGLGGTTTRR
jgi:hypothetical protein